LQGWVSDSEVKDNAGKTAVMWYGTATGLRKQLAGSVSICAGIEVVEPVSVVRDLGVWIDAELLMRDHISLPLVCATHIYAISDVSECFLAMTSLFSSYAL